MTQKTAIVKDETSGEPVIAREGDEVAYVIPVAGVVSTLTDAVMYFYREGQQTEISSTYWTGSMSVSNFSIITKQTTGLKAGNYVLSVFATVDGQVQNVVTVPFIVKRRSEP
jgi:hypothetical protein